MLSEVSGLPPAPRGRRLPVPRAAAGLGQTQIDVILTNERVEVSPGNSQKAFLKYNSHPWSAGATFQDPRMPETVHRTEPLIYYVFSSMYISLIKLNLKIRHSKRLPYNKIERLQQYAEINAMWSLSSNILLCCTHPSGDDGRWHHAYVTRWSEVVT